MIRGRGFVDHGRSEKRVIGRGWNDCGRCANYASDYDLNDHGHHENAHGGHGRTRSCQLY